eukprot:gene11750-15417_t
MAFNAVRPCQGHRGTAAGCALQSSSVRSARGGFLSRKFPALKGCAMVLFGLSVGAASGRALGGSMATNWALIGGSMATNWALIGGSMATNWALIGGSM